MKIVYTGPSPAVQVNTPNGYVGATRGVPVDFPQAVAKNLLEQDVWSVPDEVKKEQV